jgi:hypothetical protein
MDTKRCTRCQQEYPLTTEWFDPNSSKRDGLSSWCKSCRIEHNKAKRANKAREQYGDAGFITCALCGSEFPMQIPVRHLREVHGLTHTEYRNMGHETLSPARLEQLRQSPVALGQQTRHYGEKHHNYKGGHLNSGGYRVIYDPVRHKRTLEHRLVAEKMLGRPLASDEVVHHLDGNRANNSPDNLVVMKKHEHDRVKGTMLRKFEIHPETIEAAKLLYASGWNISQICRALRLQWRAVNSWVNPD